MAKENEYSKEENERLAREVGAFSYKALMHAKSMVKPGARLLDVAESTEKLARDNGFGCAFPVNLSINDQAAHYTPSLGDEKMFSEKDIVKVDFGVSKDGVLGDCAVTVDLSGQYQSLVEATEDALKDAISTVRAGVKLSTIGDAIQGAIEKRGFKPIKNLGGHGVGVHELHSEIFVPNFNNGDDSVLEEGKVIAIEPFATNGLKDFVFDSDICEIYGFDGIAPIRSPNARTVMKEIDEKYNSEPFAVRWLSSTLKDKFSLYASMVELIRSGAVTPYPTLVCLGGGMIAQAEAEVLVTKEGCEVLTKA